MFCVTLPAVIRYGIGRQDVGAVDAVAGRSEHEIVARRAPRGLLRHLDVGHAVLGEEALLPGDDQRRGIGERDEAERRLGGFRTRRMGDIGAERKCGFRRGERGDGGGRLQESPAGKTAGRRREDGHYVSVPRVGLSDRRGACGREGPTARHARDEARVNEGKAVRRRRSRRPGMIDAGVQRWTVSAQSTVTAPAIAVEDTRPVPVASPIAEAGPPAAGRPA